MTRARRASRPRFRLLPTVLLTLAILAVPTAVYAWGRTSSSFGIATVRVTGTHLVPEKRALRLLREEYAGRNLFSVTGGDVRKTLAPLCFVRGARIDRDFPETLAVTITEYEPAAYALAGSRWYVVDREGYVICSAAVAAEQLGEEAGREAVALADRELRRRRRGRCGRGGAGSRGGQRQRRPSAGRLRPRAADRRAR